MAQTERVGMVYDSSHGTLFFHLIREASHQDKNWHGIPVKRGQIITGRKKLSQGTGLTEQSVRTCLTRLKSTNEITIKTTNKYSLIEINNYNLYHPLNQHDANEQPTTNQQLTTNKNVKNVKNNTYGENSPHNKKPMYEEPTIDRLLIG